MKQIVVGDKPNISIKLRNMQHYMMDFRMLKTHLSFSRVKINIYFRKHYNMRDLLNRVTDFKFLCPNI